MHHIHVYLYIHIFMYIYIYTHDYPAISMYVSAHMYIHMCLFEHVHRHVMYIISTFILSTHDLYVFLNRSPLSCFSRKIRTLEDQRSSNRENEGQAIGLWGSFPLNFQFQFSILFADLWAPRPLNVSKPPTIGFYEIKRA